jgi:branched-chain amino acid transport system permease protein
MQKKDYIGLCGLVVIIAIIPFFITNEYYISVLVFTALNCLACVGLSLLMGYAGQISLGHAAFIGLGAYVSGYLTVNMDWSPWPALIAGIILVIFISLIIGVPALRLKGHYLAMATLGFASILHIAEVAAIDITGGPAGMSDIPYLSLFGVELDTDIRFFYFSWFVVVAGLFLALNLIHSRMGRGMRAIHGSEEAAESLGVNTSYYKIQIFILSAVYASVSGSLYAYYVNYIDPGPFGIMHSVLLVTMVAVGGMHNIWGAVAGAVLLSLLPEFLSFLTEYFQFIGIEYNQDYDMLIYGGILLSIMLFLPEGLIEGIGALAHRVVKMLARVR